MALDHHHARLTRAHATLADGCAFMMRHAADPAEAEVGLPAFAHSRLIGNRLRELDRFLSVLVEEAALVFGGKQHDARLFARLRNTPNKLQQLLSMMGQCAGDDRRLRAIGRIGACLHHCAGTIHTPALYRDIRLARGDADEIQPAKDTTARLHLTPQTIISVSQFYLTIGDRLMAETLRRPPSLDFLALGVQISAANVACDGI